jgi:hypothetical protein
VHRSVAFRFKGKSMATAIGSECIEMRTQDLGRVGIVLLGLWELVQAAGYAAMFYSALNQSSPSVAPLYRSTFLPLCASALAGGGLVLFRNPLSAVLFRTTSNFEESAPSDLQAILFSVAGVLLAARALISLGEGEVGHLLGQRFAKEELGFRFFLYAAPTDAWVLRVQSGVQLLVGIGLFFGADGLASLWRTFRTAGRRSWRSRPRWAPQERSGTAHFGLSSCNPSHGRMCPEGGAWTCL